MAMIAMCLSLGRAKTKSATAALAEASPRLLPRLLQVPDMYICPSVYLFGQIYREIDRCRICISVHLSISLYICPSVYLSICTSVPDL